MRSSILAMLLPILPLLPTIDNAGARPREFTVWDNEKAQWTNPNPQDLAEDVSPLRSVQSNPTILPTFRKMQGGTVTQPSRKLPTAAKKPQAVAKGGVGPQNLARRVAP
jgi:hypothetical protein